MRLRRHGYMYNTFAVRLHGRCFRRAEIGRRQKGVNTPFFSTREPLIYDDRTFASLWNSLPFTTENFFDKTTVKPKEKLAVRELN